MGGGGINMAALGALLRGDIDNAVLASTPGGILAQEAQGQRTLVSSDMLPRDIDKRVTREQLTALGFVFGPDIDDVFVSARLPPGWTKRATDHSMNSEVLDEQGRVRATIFYKAAFYDRHADLRMMPRYTIADSGAVEDETYTRNVWVKDADGTVMHEVGQATGYAAVDLLHQQARDWLVERFPECHNPLAYW